MLNSTIIKKKALLITVLVGVVALAFGFYATSDSRFYEDGGYTYGEGCNALVLSAYGHLTTYMPENPNEYWEDTTSSEEIVDGILEAQNDNVIKAVVLYVDSGGGEPVAGEEIANALKRLSKPSVAVIRGMGASGAYWASTGADKIYASRISDVGSIAVTASYLDESRRIERDGYQYTELTSGRFKDLGDPNKPLTVEERGIVMSDLRKMHNVFVQDVATNRELEVSEVEKLANGLTYTGIDALAYGLIDEIGDLDTATKYLEEVLGEKVEYCWY